MDTKSNGITDKHINGQRTSGIINHAGVWGRQINHPQDLLKVREYFHQELPVKVTEQQKIDAYVHFRVFPF